MENNPQTLIIGAGITGLCVAHSLHQSGNSFQMLETSNSIGGALQSYQSDGFLAEHGPNSLLLKDKRIVQLFEKIGLNISLIQDAKPEAHNRFIVSKGKLCSVPTSPLKILSSPLLNLTSILRLTKEPFTSRYNSNEEESFASFVKRRLGLEILTNLAEPFVSGIYAGDPNQLSVKHAFPRLWALEKDHRSLFLTALTKKKTRYKNPHTLSPTRTISFKGGLKELPKAIAKKFDPNAIQLESKIQKISQKQNGWEIIWLDSKNIAHTSHYKKLVIAIPHHQLFSLPLPAEVLQQLEPALAIKAPPVTSLVLGFKRSQIAHPLNGFGMLIKASEKSPLLGVLFSSNMFDHRAPDNHVTLTCMMGGTRNPKNAENEDHTVIAELNRLLGVQGAPVFRHRTHWKNAIPQYNIGYQSVIDALENCEESHPNLHFCGNYRGGVSVTDCIINGLELGQQLSSSHE